MCQGEVVETTPERAPMGDVSTIGLDTAKRVFQLHGADPTGLAVVRKKLPRDRVLQFLSSQPRCVVALEACGGLASLGPGDCQTRPRSAPDPSQIRQALCQTPQKNDACRCRSYMRGSTAPKYALCGGQKRRRSGKRPGVPRTGFVGPSTHTNHQRATWPSNRIRLRGGQRGRPTLQS